MSAGGETAGNALISVYDKTGIEDFAAGLYELDWSIYASGGTHSRIHEAGIPVTDVAELVGGGAILGHKVVTLSRELAAGLLADPKNPEEVAEMERLRLPLIDLVCQDSYPLETEIAKEGSTPVSVNVQTDIGGPNMLREAAKGGRIVLSVPEQRKLVLDWLRDGRPNEEEFIRELADRARYEVARYTMLEASYWNGAKMSGHIALLHAPVKYGENPYMTPAALYADNRVEVDPLGLDQFKHVKGWEQSFINTTDMDSLLQTATHIAAGFERNFQTVPHMAIGVKHGNACGAGLAETMVDAVQKMLEGDTRAIFGGVVMINGTIDKDVAETLMHYAMEDTEASRLLDGVVGAAVTDEALEVLSRKKLRVVVNPALNNLNESSLDQSRRVRPVRGGVLVQPNYTFVQDLSAEHMQFFGELTEQQRQDVILAWAIGSTSNSNTLSLVKNGKLIGNGVGQQDRVGAGQLAISRTTVNVPHLDNLGDQIGLHLILDAEKLDGAVAYSDSFFPFPDGPQLLVDAGIKAILTTWTPTSEAHKNILADIHSQGVAVVVLPDTVGRGFAKH